MAFTIKHLLFWMAVIAFGLVAMFTQNTPVLGKLFDLVTLGILIGMAYGAWLSTGEQRAFRIGFLGWAIMYLFLFKPEFDVGITDLMNRAYRATQPPVVVPTGGGGGFGGGGFVGGWGYSNYYPVFHCLLLLLLGLIGGWVSVYVYRKRERMLAQRSQLNSSHVDQR